MRDLPDYHHSHKLVTPSSAFWTPICSLQGKIYFTSVWDSSLFFETVILQVYHITLLTRKGINDLIFKSKVGGALSLKGNSESWSRGNLT